MSRSDVRVAPGRRLVATAGAAILGAGLLALAGTAPAAASVITGVGASIFPGASTGTIGPVGATPAPNNDNAAASPNVIPYSVFFNTMGVLDVEFTLANSGGTTEYLFSQTLVNNTGTAWSGFRYELGFGTGAGFVASTLGDGLDFDAPDGDPAPTSNAFAVLDLDADLLDWSDGAVASLGTLLQTLSIDLPDNLAAFHPGGQNSFTLRQRPIAADAGTVLPEPGGLGLLLGVVLGGLALRRRRPLEARCR